MKKTLIVVMVATLLGCNKNHRMVDSSTRAIRDQTEVLKKIEQHLLSIANELKAR